MTRKDNSAAREVCAQLWQAMRSADNALRAFEKDRPIRCMHHLDKVEEHLSNCRRICRNQTQEGK